MNKKIALLMAYVFVCGQVFAPVAFAQTNTSGAAKVVVADDLQAQKASRSGQESSLYADMDENEALNKRVSVNVNNMPIGTFLSSIARQSKINFIMDDNKYSDKRVTASLKDVTAKEALDTLLRVQGLTYQRIGKSDNYVITKRSDELPDLITKVYTLNYVSLQPQATMSQNIQNIMPADSTSSSFGSSSSGLSSVNVFDSGSAGGPGFTLGANTSGGGGSGSNDGSAILDVIKSVLSNQGRIAVDARTNKLIVSDVPEVFPQIEAILAELDVKAPQVLIEAQIVEVSKTSGFDVGFNWNLTGTFTAGTTSIPWDWIKSGTSGNFLRWFGADGTGGTKAMELDFKDLNVVFTALMKNGEARSLGKPKVITMNNNPAVITSAREAAVSNITKSNDASTTSYSGVERKTVGLKLTVTPQVNKEGYVTLNVAPSYSDLVASETVSPEEQTYDTVTRAVSTLVRVKSGQTVVLGGLLQSSEKENVLRVPLLGQIPVLGWLFTSKTKSKSTTDLVIFLTPTVLSE